MLNQEKKSKYYLVATSGDLAYGAMGAYSSNYEIEEKDVEMFNKYIRLEKHLVNEFNETYSFENRNKNQDGYNEHGLDYYGFSRKWVKLDKLRSEKYVPFVKEKLNNPSKYFFRSSWTITSIEI